MTENDHNRRSELCPRCELGVIAGIEQLDSTFHRHFLRCPRCGWAKRGELVSGVALEAERELWVTVRLQSQMSSSQLRALRAMQVKGDNETVVEFMERVRKEATLRLGPFWPKPKAIEVARKLAEVGLEATITQ